MARQADLGTAPGILAAWMAPFAECFTRPTWANLLVLATGAILSPGRRTVATALSSVGLRGAVTFTNYHRVLNRSRWSGQAAAPCLLGLLVAAWFKKCHFQVTPEIDRAVMVKGLLVLGVTLI